MWGNCSEHVALVVNCVRFNKGLRFNRDGLLNKLLNVILADADLRL